MTFVQSALTFLSLSSVHLFEKRREEKKHDRCIRVSERIFDIVNEEDNGGKDSRRVTHTGGVSCQRDRIHSSRTEHSWTRTYPALVFVQSMREWRHATKRARAHTLSDDQSIDRWRGSRFEASDVK